MRVIGTAGHVDHGKSTLVRALSGIEPDRLKEEQARGLTIDLGFAWMDLPIPQSGEPQSIESIGIVDVPGHIDFIKNMLAGVGSIDAAILVIAADEGVMPQTREHLAILDLLAVPAAVIALTKTDLIDDPEWLDLVELDVEDLLQTTHLAGSSVVRVSATEGSGLDDLRAELGRILGTIAPQRDRRRPRLPVDRVFTLSGFGTIVTGTLVDGSFATGDTVEILPSGTTGRIRGLQTHKTQAVTAHPGSRLAINLGGISADEVHRGDVVTRPDTLTPTKLIDVSFRLLADAAKPILHNQRVDFFSGATEVLANVRLLGATSLEPGEAGWLQLRLDRPVVVAAGDRFILRQPSPSATLGGGAVLAPHPRRRYRRFDEQAIARLRLLAQGTPDQLLLHTLDRHPFLTADEWYARSGLDVSLAHDAAQELVQSGAVVQIETGSDAVLAAADDVQETFTEMAALVSDYHRSYPLRRGMPRGELRSRISRYRDSRQQELPVRLFNALLSRAQQEGTLHADDAVTWLPEFSVVLTNAQSNKVAQLHQVFAEACYSPPGQQEVLRLLDGQTELLEALIADGGLVRLEGGVLFRRREYDEMVQKISAHLRETGSITLADTRDMFGTSRKYAQAVLEQMDADRITRRDGDKRVLR